MNATVSLPISELDTLREDLKSAKEKVSEFEKREKQVKIIVVKKEQGYNWNHISRSLYGEPEVKQHEVVDSITYVGFEVVKEDLRQKAENNVISKIHDLESSVKSAQKAKYEALDKLKEETKEALAKKDKEIACLMKEEVDKTKDEEIQNLNNTITQLKADYKIAAEQIKLLTDKNWFQSLFNL